MKVGTGKYTYELVENFAKLPEGETFGVISRVTTDSQNRLYVFQRKDPAVMIFDKDGKFQSSWGSGVFKRAHGFKIVNDFSPRTSTEIDTKPCASGFNIWFFGSEQRDIAIL